MNRHYIRLMNLGLVLIPYLIYVAYLWNQVPLKDGLPSGTSDPDSWLRLVMLREWILSGDWYNHAIPHYNPPFGSIIHWTRPVDLVEAAIVYVLPGADLNLSLLRMALLVPVLWLGLLMLGIYRIVERHSDIPASYLMTAVMLAAMPIARNYFGLGNADHHAPLAVLFIWILALATKPTSTRREAIAIGILFALMLWISFEALILLLLVGAWFAIQWLQGDEGAAITLRRIMVSSFLAGLLALMIEHPPELWFTPAYDVFSIVYVALLLCAASLSCLITFTRNKPLRLRCILVGLAGLLQLASILYLFPDIIRGPMALAHPIILSEILPNVEEAAPMLSQPILKLIALLLYPLVTIFICIRSVRVPASSYYDRQNAFIFLYFTLTLLLLCFYQIRFSYYLYPLVIAILAPVIGALFSPEQQSVSSRWPAKNFLRLSPRHQPILRMLIVSMAIGIPMGLYLASPTPTPTNTDLNQRYSLNNSCMKHASILIRSGALNHALGDTQQTILVPTDIGPEVLFFTPYSIIAANYHRDGEAMKYVWDTYAMTEAAALQTQLADRNITAIINCAQKISNAGVLFDYATGTKPLPKWLAEIPYDLPESSATAADAASMYPQLLKVINTH